MTIESIIYIAKKSQYLALTNTVKNGFASGGVDIQLPTKIYNIRKSVEWRYNINNDEDAQLRATANYLFALCAPYSLQPLSVSQQNTYLITEDGDQLITENNSNIITQ